MADVVDRVETHALELPYARPVRFHAVTEARGRYLILRLVTQNGVAGLAESVCRPAQTGDTPAQLAAEVARHLAPLLRGVAADADGVLDAVAASRAGPAARALADVALWDLRARVRGVPAWQLLGPGPARPVPLAWVVHGDDAATQVREAARAVAEGFTGLKLKTWRRGSEDVDLVRAVRAAVGPAAVLWVDANGSYTQAEARAIFPDLAELGVAFVEDPCASAAPSALAELARDLPLPVLGDEWCATRADVERLLDAGALGGVSLKLRRTGLTESLAILDLARSAGVPCLIGTDSESRIGALARAHLRAARPDLDPWPAETHFFQKLRDDAFRGDFPFDRGHLSLPDQPGFGADLDRDKLERYATPLP